MRDENQGAGADVDDRVAYKQGTQDVKNARSLINRLEYLHRKIRTHIVAGQAGIAGVPRGIGGPILREAKATKWALELAYDVIDAGPVIRDEIDVALDAHDVFLGEIPDAVLAANDRDGGA